MSNLVSKMTKPRVLLLDDDQEIRHLLSLLLTQSGFEVTAVGDIASFERSLSLLSIDVCIIDWMLMGESGLTLAQGLSRLPERPPMLMLSANASLDQRLEGLAVVDDYLTKPFEPAELIARLHVLLRRFHNDKTEQTLRLGTWTVESQHHRLSNPDQVIELNANEWQVLWYFVQRPHRIITREQLLDLFGDQETSARAIDIRISRLRKKIGDESFIETVWGQGYRLGEHLTRAQA
jgi:DNA-binding response OmpR family regulator